MKYRAKITNIVPLIRNISKYSERYICKDTKDLYIEVETEEEQSLIELIDYYQFATFETYKKLLNLK